MTRPPPGTASYWADARRLTVAAVACTVLAGCSPSSTTPDQTSSGEAAATGSATHEGRADDALSGLTQDLYPQGVTGAKASAKTIPDQLSYPPPGSPSRLLADPPPAASVMVTESDSLVDRFYAHRGFSDITLYFYGVDGRWRVLNMAELGISSTDFYGSDTGVGGLSPDGRYWAFRTLTRIGILNLTTARVSFTPAREPEGWRGRPEWRSDGLLVGPAAGGAELVDPTNGRLVTWTPSGARKGIRRTAYLANGSAVRLAGKATGGTRRLVWIDGSGADEWTLPFRLPGSVPISATRNQVALLSTRDEQEISPEYSNARFRLIVTDSEGEPSAVLGLGRVRTHKVDLLGWADRNTVLIYVRGLVLAWRPDDQSLTQVTKLGRTANASFALHALLRPGAARTGRAR